MTLLKHSTLSLVILVCLVVAGCESTTAPPSGSSASSSSVKTAPPAPKPQPGEDIVVIETEYGKVKIQLYPDIAPKHVEAFKKRVSEGFYNGLAFHRAVPNLIVQGGDPNTRDKGRETWGMGDENLPKINAEFSDRPFIKGTLGAARAQDPNSASTQFFICVSEYPDWNGQYTNFGQVISGLSNVQVMTMAPTDERQTLKDKIVMTKVYLE
ncbi:MAG TPA: peptidylprolyl isomerase, partial [Blastocatellia bacterium]|nr:peptidylprolyl isomerase [Blastocatellia bacterium]